MGIKFVSINNFHSSSCSKFSCMIRTSCSNLQVLSSNLRNICVRLCRWLSKRERKHNVLLQIHKDVALNKKSATQIRDQSSVTARLCLSRQGGMSGCGGILPCSCNWNVGLLGHGRPGHETS